MTSQFSSSNPFRRKPQIVPPAPADVIQEKTANISATPTTPDLPGVTVKPIKKVRLQSPPPPSSPGTIATAQRPPNPIPISPLSDEVQPDPFDTPERAVQDEISEHRGYFHAPPNPFAKTLENLEPAEAISPGMSTKAQPIHGSGRASLDVDAFKRLLMTGNSGRTAAFGTPPHQTSHNIIPDGTSTDTSSVSRQSIFESIQEAHIDSPRTSHELSEQENERYIHDHSTGRKKPPPPSSRHGKLIKMELRDDPSQMKDPSRPSSSSSKVSQQFSYLSSSPLTRSQTDLNKPLPAAPPRRPSNELNNDEQESIFDKEAAGKIPEPPSPTSSITRKAPPAPPITRRHSQLVSSSRSRGDSGHLSPRLDEEPPSPIDFVRERSSSSSSTAPPPPPSRRHGSLRSPSQAPPLPSPPATSVDNMILSPKIAPAPPPTRSLSTRKLSRPASVISMESQKESHRRSAPPPPPPRHRSSGRNSMDNPVFSPVALSSGDSFKRSAESSRRTSAVLERPETPETVMQPKGPDILADLSALQRDVEAAMAQQRKVSS